MPVHLILSICLILGLSGAPCWAQFKVTKTGDSVVDAEALTIQGGFGQAINGKAFQQEARKYVRLSFGMTPPPRER